MSRSSVHAAADSISLDRKRSGARCMRGYHQRFPVAHLECVRRGARHHHISGLQNH
jgi:hypothetical protein